MLTIEKLLESLTEAIRLRRRIGPFPSPFETSHITWNTEKQRINLSLLECKEGEEIPSVVKYDLYLVKVNEHGELDERFGDNAY